MIVSIKNIKSNKTNPRNITPEKLEKLKKSISDFPDMLNKRPLVCFTDKDGKYVVLGGNMRLKACKELGIKELPIMLADEWTEVQKNEFIIKDNVGFGEWDWDILEAEWGLEGLEDWGLDLPLAYLENDKEPEFDKDTLSDHLDAYVNGSIKQVVLYYPQKEYEQILKDFDKLKEKYKVEDNAQLISKLISDAI